MEYKTKLWLPAGITISDIVITFGAGETCGIVRNMPVTQVCWIKTWGSIFFDNAIIELDLGMIVYRTTWNRFSAILAIQSFSCFVHIKFYILMANIFIKTLIIFISIYNCCLR